MMDFSQFHNMMQNLVSTLNTSGMVLPPFNERYPKSDISAECCRVQGNIQFKRKDFRMAILFYNGSLCYAPAGSVNIALAYGNRSAVYCEAGKYALAIENIKLARENGFPAEKMSQLDAREEKCKKLMKEFGPEKGSVASSFFKLSHPPNEKIPFIAGCLELRKNEKYGRHIVTTKDLKPGDIIAVESLVFTYYKSSVSLPACNFCTKFNKGSLIPCSHCTSVMYCSEECKEKAALVHFNDGFNDTYRGQFKFVLKMLLEAFRVAGGVDELLELLKEAENKTIFDFDFSNPDDPAHEKNMLMALNGLWKNIDEQEEMVEVKLELLDIPAINEKPRTARERKQLLKLIVNQYKICASSLLDHTNKHCGISLLHALLNHSCLPNVLTFKFGNKSVLIVIRPIKAGEQIFVAYGLLATTHPKEVRQKVLQEVFHFKCDCEACVNDYPMQLPRKDRHFVEPNFHAKLNEAEAVEQFKKNCKYIDKNAEEIPCYEIQSLIDHNCFLLTMIDEDFMFQTTNQQLFNYLKP